MTLFQNPLIGMKDVISDPAAKIFASHFYSAIGFGFDLAKALNQAKAALMLESIPEENIPALFTNDNEQPNEIILVKPLDLQRSALWGEL